MPQVNAMDAKRLKCACMPQVCMYATNLEQIYRTNIMFVTNPSHPAKRQASLDTYVHAHVCTRMCKRQASLDTYV